MIYHKEQIVRRVAYTDLTACEGQFVRLEGNEVDVVSGGFSASEVYGLLHGVDEQGKLVDVILPGYAGIVGVKVDPADTAGVLEGDPLIVSAKGTVKSGSDGIVVAYALQDGSAGNIIAARLVEPQDAAAGIEATDVVTVQSATATAKKATK